MVDMRQYITRQYSLEVGGGSDTISMYSVFDPSDPTSAMTQLKEDWDFVDYIIQNESTHPYFVLWCYVDFLKTLLSKR